jgi:FkbM family methyltransferase
MRSPLEAVITLRGTNVADELRILWALLAGSVAYAISKFLVRDMMVQVFGANYIGFIEKLTNVHPMLCIFLDGTRFFIRDPIDYNAVSPSWEPELKRVLRPKRGEVMIDLGAHVGAYAIRLAKVVEEKGMIIALEPDFENFAFLKMNVKLNNLRNVITLPIAAYESDGSHIMYRSACTGIHSLTMIPPKSLESAEVPTITLDTLVKKFKLDRIDFLKIDVEGAELAVLKGAYNALRIVKKMYIEAWHENVDAIFKILNARSFQTLVLWEDKLSVNILAENQNIMKI